jgi:hypothetical protein
MPTIYSRRANLEEVPEVGETVTLPTEELELPSSNTKERDGESEMGFKVVDRDYGSPTEITGGGDSTHYITLIVTNFDAS